MPYININDCNYYYEVHGNGKETIVFSHGLLWSGFLFKYQVEHFKKKYKVVTYDHRGQGKSEVTEKRYDMDSLYEDTVQLIEKLNLGSVHFAGLSMGGFVAMRLSARRPDLVKSLILMETSARPETKTLKYSFLIIIVKIFGVSIVTSEVLKIMFGDSFLNDKSRIIERVEFENELKKNKKSIIKAVEGVISRKGIEEELHHIKCPTLIIVGDQDKATIPEEAKFIQKNITDSRLEIIKNAGHTSSLEEPEVINKVIDEFLDNCN